MGAGSKINPIKVRQSVKYGINFVTVSNEVNRHVSRIELQRSLTAGIRRDNVETEAEKSK